MECLKGERESVCVRDQVHCLELTRRTRSEPKREPRHTDEKPSQLSDVKRPAKAFPKEIQFRTVSARQWKSTGEAAGAVRKDDAVRSTISGVFARSWKEKALTGFPSTRLAALPRLRFLHILHRCPLRTQRRPLWGCFPSQGAQMFLEGFPF